MKLFKDRTRLIFNELAKIKVLQSEIGERYGVSQATVSRLATYDDCPRSWEERIDDMQIVYNINATWWKFGLGDHYAVGELKNPRWGASVDDQGEAAPGVRKMEEFYKKILLLKDENNELKLENMRLRQRNRELEQLIDKKKKGAKNGDK